MGVHLKKTGFLIVTREREREITEQESLSKRKEKVGVTKDRDVESAGPAWAGI
jgi:hypothetical protein